MKQYIFFTILFILKLGESFSQEYLLQLPKPRLEVNVYTGFVFVNPNGASSSYNNDSFNKDELNFPAQKEFGFSPNLGFEIFYPSSKKYFIGFNFDYLQSSLIARYKDVYGTYDLEASVVNYSYQFIPRIIIADKRNTFWYIQGGFGGSIAFEESAENIASSEFTNNISYRTEYEINRASTLYGFITSAKTGVQQSLGQFSLGASIGYRLSLNLAADNSYIHGFVGNFALGYNFIR